MPPKFKTRTQTARDVEQILKAIKDYWHRESVIYTSPDPTSDMNHFRLQIPVWCQLSITGVFIKSTEPEKLIDGVLSLVEARVKLTERVMEAYDAGVIPAPSDVEESTVMEFTL